jgi:hypothetical protein
VSAWHTDHGFAARRHTRPLIYPHSTAAMLTAERDRRAFDCRGF